MKTSRRIPLNRLNAMRFSRYTSSKILLPTFSLLLHFLISWNVLDAAQRITQTREGERNRNIFSLQQEQKLHIAIVIFASLFQTVGEAIIIIKNMAVIERCGDYNNMVRDITISRTKFEMRNEVFILSKHSITIKDMLDLHKIADPS